MQLLSICIPVFNEEKNVQNTYDVIKKILNQKLENLDYEIIFADNHSTDNTNEILEKICAQDSKVKYLRYNRNIGYDRSLLQAYINSSGDAVVSIDCDLQDSPDIIFEFLNKWREGYDLVYGIRKKRLEGGLFTIFRRIFYLLINYFSEEKYPKDVGDFKLIDKSIVQILRNINEPYPYVRGLVYSNSKKSIGLDYNRDKRKYGESKYGFFSASKYALNAILENSYLFNSIFRYLSMFALILSFIFIVISLFSDNYSTINFVFVFIFSAGLLLLSIILEYITRIYFYLKNKNSFFYEKKINL